MMMLYLLLPAVCHRHQYTWWIASLLLATRMWLSLSFHPSIRPRCNQKHWLAIRERDVHRRHCRWSQPLLESLYSRTSGSFPKSGMLAWLGPHAPSSLYKGDLSVVRYCWEGSKDSQGGCGRKRTQIARKFYPVSSILASRLCTFTLGSSKRCERLWL